jgi:hypothetical protein
MSISLSTKGNYQGLREFFIASDTDTKQADDITANVPKYIPANVFKLASATTENILVALSSDEEKFFIYLSILCVTKQKITKCLE